MKRIEYLKGQNVNGFIFRNNAESSYDPDGRERRYGLFICPICNNEFRSYLPDVKSGKIKSCGCYRKEITTKRFTVHGLNTHIVYTTWRNIIGRCYYEKNNSYKNYGARGIKIQPNWRYNFLPFFNYVVSLHNYNENNIGTKSNQLSLDRINNDGDYEVNNLRWATRKEQANNKRHGI